LAAWDLRMQFHIYRWMGLGEPGIQDTPEYIFSLVKAAKRSARFHIG